MTAPDTRIPDEAAIERYRYLLRTAPPDMIEQAHAEAFAQLTPDQRRQVLAALADQVPAQERMSGDDPQSLARLATRAELRQPGTLERTFGSMESRGAGWGPTGGGLGMGGMFMGMLAASFIGTAVAQAFFADPGAYGAGYQEGYEAGSDGAGGTDVAAGEAGGAEAEAGGFAGGESSSGGWATDPGAGDAGTGDVGGDFGGGDLGGDFGGGDFGGDDFGGF